MIIIAGTIDLDPDRRQEALEEACALMGETRDQKGCQHYLWAADGFVPGRIYVYEQWDDSDALASHYANRYYKDMLALIGRYRPRQVEVQKYRVDHHEPVYDDKGVPRADFFAG